MAARWSDELAADEDSESKEPWLFLPVLWALEKSNVKKLLLTKLSVSKGTVGVPTSAVGPGQLQNNLQPNATNQQNLL